MNFASLLLACFVALSRSEFPANEYDYSIQRDALIAAETRINGLSISMTEDEEIVDHYLNHIKWKEFQRTLQTGFPPSRPIEETLDDIVQSEVFEILKTFPKGGLLHTHENHQLSKRKMLDIIWESDEFKHLYILPENSTIDPFKLDFFIKPPENEGWERVQDHQDVYDRETLFHKYNLISILDKEARSYPTDSAKRWDLMNTLWGKASSQLIANRPIKIKYLEAMYEQSLKEGVIYLETRKHLGSGDELIYVLDSDPQYASTHGKRYLEDNGEYDVDITMETVKHFTAQFPNFVDHKRIVYTQRQQPFETIVQDMERTKHLHALYPQHVIGYDVVGHEDAGNSHLYYIAEFLKQYNAETKESDLDFYFHAAETKWTDDLSASTNDVSDPVGSSQNIYEAVLLGAKRIGHGTGYLKHPYLLHLLEERDVAIEVCPVSGMVLGYFPDLRNHQGIYHFRNGGKVVLGSDDAGSFGFDYFTVDWYDVFMAWGLNLKDLKQLALNSLKWSAMDASKKESAMKIYDNMWDKYIQNIKTKACSEDMTNNTPTFARLLPRHGPTVGGNVVHVFGRNFERGICKEVKCLFNGTEAASTRYITVQHIACTAPPGADGQVKVSVAFDGVEFESGEMYTYNSDLDTPPVTTSDPSNSGSIAQLSFIVITLIPLIRIAL